MNGKKRKPIPTTLGIGLIVGIIGGVLYRTDMGGLTASLCIMLALMIVTIDMVLLPVSTILLRDELSKKTVNRYRNFAKFYLNNRRFRYTKSNFESAVTNGWTDIVTMCLLLGMRKAFEFKEAEILLLDVIDKGQGKMFKVLLRGGFSANFIVSTTGEHLIFEVVKEDNPLYLKTVLENRVQANTVNTQGETPLYTAIRDYKHDHVQLLLEHGASLEVVNEDGLTPLFYALAIENMEACELILDRMGKKKSVHTITHKRLKEKLIVNDKPASNFNELVLELIASKDAQVLRMLRSYFANKKNFFVKIETSVELYARLSTIEGSMVKKKEVVGGAPTIYTEAECKEDLITYILRHYRFNKAGDFAIDGIYEQAKCVDSYKEPCEACEGKGKVLCGVCEGKGYEPCEACEGTGQRVCSKCDGTKEMSCEHVQKYIECKNCKDGTFECVKCDDEGKHLCPECKGHGTTKCTCPSDKKTKCPHCDKGYISVKGGMYKKCSHCKDGYICGLCKNTGWVDKKYIASGYKCRVCKGEGHVACRTCRGNKKVKCSKRFKVPCDCGTGSEVCSVCEGKKVRSCKACEGSKYQPCEVCQDGYLYKNVYMDFKTTQSIKKEMIATKTSEPAKLEGLTQSLARYIAEEHHYVDEVYTLFKIGMLPGDVEIANNTLQVKIGKMIKEAEKEGVLDILELVPLHYTTISFQEKSGKKYQCLLVNETFYKMNES